MNASIPIPMKKCTKVKTHGRTVQVYGKLHNNYGEVYHHHKYYVYEYVGMRIKIKVYNVNVLRSGFQSHLHLPNT